MNTGKKIKELREQKNMSVVDLSKKLGVSRGVVYGYEIGDRVPPHPKLKRLAEIFEVPISVLLESGSGNVPKFETKPETWYQEQIDRLNKINLQLSDTVDRLARILESQTGAGLGKLFDLKKKDGFAFPIGEGIQIKNAA